MIEKKYQQAARILIKGGIIAYPTEATFGLGCDPDNADAVSRLLWLKKRPINKGLILVAGQFSHIAPYLAPLTTEQQHTLINSWPGPHTWLVPTTPWVPRLLRGDHDTLAVRITDHPVAAALCNHYRSALVSTSANFASQPPARTSTEVRLRLGKHVDYIVSGCVGGHPTPSIIRDLRTGEVIRA